MEKFTHRVVRDCGYGRVWTRLATDADDALAEMLHWQREGLPPAAIKVGLRNGGEFRIEPIAEVAQ